MNSELHRFFLKETQKHHIRNGSKKDGDEGLVFPFVGDKNDRCCEQFRYCGRDTAGGNIFHTVNDQYRQIIYVKSEDYELLVRTKDLLEQYIDMNRGFDQLRIQFDFNPLNI